MTLIADMLRAIAEYSKNDRGEFIKAITDAQEAQQNGDIIKKQKRLVIAQKRALELEILICKIYEDNILGKLPDARYAALDEQYAKEQGALSVEIKELETAVHGFEKCRKSAERFITLVEKYENFDTLTTTMLNEFVEKIHATDEFKEMERMRSRARHNEAAALHHSAEVEREKWQGVVTEQATALAEKDAALSEKDVALSEKDAALAEQAALIAELRKQIHEGN